MVVDQQQLKDQEAIVALTKIKPGVTYNIMVDVPDGTYLYTVTYEGEPTPPAIYYDVAPIEPIPASFPNAYQNAQTP